MGSLIARRSVLSEHMIYNGTHSFDLCVVLYNYRARYRLIDPLDYDIC